MVSRDLVPMTGRMRRTDCLGQAAIACGLRLISPQERGADARETTPSHFSRALATGLQNYRRCWVPMLVHLRDRYASL